MSVNLKPNILIVLINFPIKLFASPNGDGLSINDPTIVTYSGFRRIKYSIADGKNIVSF